MERSFDFERLQGRALRRRRILRVLTYLLLGVWAVVVLFPFYWMLLTSVKDYGAYNAEHIPTFFTLSPTLQNYKDALLPPSPWAGIWPTRYSLPWSLPP